MDFSAQTVAERFQTQGEGAVKALFESQGIRPGGWGLPEVWRGSDDDFQRGLRDLPRLARCASAIGGTRVTTWILPCSDDRSYEENYQFHVERLTPCAKILADQGCSLGLEFIGPKTLRDSKKHPFIHTMAGMLDLGREVGPNVGLLLDCWHWYTSHATLADLAALTPEQVVYVHVNDAPAGIPIDEQRDDVRALPGETGVIDIAGFLQALARLGYDGPVTPEPFKKELSDLPSDEARLKMAGASLDKIFQQAKIAAR